MTNIIQFPHQKTGADYFRVTSFSQGATIARRVAESLYREILIEEMADAQRAGWHVRAYTSGKVEGSHPIYTAGKIEILREGRARS